MNDNVNIVFYVGDDDHRICRFGTTQFAEWLKLLEFAKNHDVMFTPRSDDDNINDQYISSIGYFVEDYKICFGSDICIQQIQVYLKD